MSFHIKKYPTCRHTKTDGRLCQAPAHAPSAYCFFHKKLHRGRASLAGPGMSTNVLHPLRNARSIREALAMTVSRLASGQLDHKQAGKMLYALNLATARLPKTRQE